jgi:hypothetical protein
MVLFIKKQSLLSFLFFLSCLAFIFVIQKPIFYYYVAVFYLLILILENTSKRKNNFEYQFFKLFSYFFVLFVLFVRSEFIQFSKTINYFLNTLEHLFFALVVCFFMNFIVFSFNKSLLFIKRLFFVVIAFNIIGLLNELFQNYFQDKALFSINIYSLNDIIVNLIGSVVFVIILIINKLR